MFIKSDASSDIAERKSGELSNEPFLSMKSIIGRMAISVKKYTYKHAKFYNLRCIALRTTLNFTL